MNKINWKDVAARTAKTFVATFIGTFSFVDVLFVVKDKHDAAGYITTSLISAASAAVTAVWNMLLEIFGDRINAAVEKVVTWIFGLFQKKTKGEGIDQLGGEEPPGNADAQIEDDELEEFHAEYYADDDENENDRAGEGAVG